MKHPINIVTLISSVLLASVVAAYLFTPLLDEWVIQKSLRRYCDGVKEVFEGQFYSPAYLCTFIEGSE